MMDSYHLQVGRDDTWYGRASSLGSSMHAAAKSMELRSSQAEDPGRKPGANLKHSNMPCSERPAASTRRARCLPQTAHLPRQSTEPVLECALRGSQVPTGVEGVEGGGQVHLSS